jgi:hypothetical protein
MFRFSVCLAVLVIVISCAHSFRVVVHHKGGDSAAPYIDEDLSDMSSPLAKGRAYGHPVADPTDPWEITAVFKMIVGIGAPTCVIGGKRTASMVRPIRKNANLWIATCMPQESPGSSITTKFMLIWPSTHKLSWNRVHRRILSEN